MLRPAVVLPQPDSPTMATVSACWMSKLMPSTALTSPTWLRRKPLKMGKYFFRPRTGRAAYCRSWMGSCVLPGECSRLFGRQGMVTPHLVTVAQIMQGRDCGAEVRGPWAAVVDDSPWGSRWVEAPCRRCCRAGRRAGPGRGAPEAPGRVRVGGAVEQVDGGCRLGHPSGVEHHHAVTAQPPRRGRG